MNLCNSGMALMCYSSGKAVDEAVDRIHRHRPDLVTLQEICRDDLHARHGWGKLTRAMAARYGTDRVSVSFAPTLNRYTGAAYRCVNGEEFGVAMIHQDTGRGAHFGSYRSQDSTDEIRTWTCATVVEGRLTGCTTHLSTTPDVAVRQCRELMAVLRSPWVLPQVIVAGDVNLPAEPGAAYNVQACAPADYDHRSDGSVQHVLFSRNIDWVGGGYHAMRWTDHPALYQRLRL